MSNTLVVGTVALAVGSNEAKKLAGGKAVTAQPVIGGFILGLFLFAITSFNPQLGTRFCYLVIAAALLTNGVAIFQVASKLATPGAPTGTSSANVIKPIGNTYQNTGPNRVGRGPRN